MSLKTLFIGAGAAAALYIGGNLLMQDEPAKCGMSPDGETLIETNRGNIIKPLYNWAVNTQSNGSEICSTSNLPGTWVVFDPSLYTRYANQQKNTPGHP